MAQGQVSSDALNLFQGDIAGVERKILYIGNAPLHQLTWQFANAQTDFDLLLGSAASELKTQMIVAQANGGDRWSAYVIPKDPDTDSFIAFGNCLAAMGTIIPFEGMALCDAAENLARGLDNIQPGIEGHLHPAGVYPFVLVALPGIDAETQTWSEYKTAMNALSADIVADSVCAVPQLHGNNIGVLGGRLCRNDLSVADSPMRVASGALIGLGDDPVDSEGAVLSPFDMADLDGFRYSVPQVYLDFPGKYWGDANMLTVPASDYAVIENFRVMRKAQRKVRILQILRVADRQLNNTPGSIAANKIYFSRPLREMSRGFQIGSVTIPGDIKVPANDAITIVWMSHTRVDIFIKITPYESPKDLRSHVSLDLLTGLAEFG